MIRSAPASRSFYATVAKSRRQLEQALFSPTRSGEAAREAGLSDIEILERAGAQHAAPSFSVPPAPSAPSPRGASRESFPEHPPNEFLTNFSRLFSLSSP